ncbi:MAG: sulfotransferase [Pseudomonadota bacterium]
MRPPDFFIVGAPKAATSSLHLFLNKRSDVFMCSPKEPHFFSTDLPGLAEVKTREAYDALFESAEAHMQLGEASAFYLRSTDAAANIHKANPDARIVMSLRNPVSASMSWYHQLRDGFREDQTGFEASWDLQAPRAAGDRHPPYCPEPAQLQYLELYDYAPQIARYLDIFRRDQIEIFRFEQIKADPVAVAAELQQFLGLSPDDEPQVIGSTNSRRQQKMPGLTQFLSAPPPVLRPLVNPTKRALNALGIKPSVLMMKYLTRPATAEDVKVHVDETTQRRVADAFAPSIDRLEALLGESFDAWR